MRDCENCGIGKRQENEILCEKFGTIQQLKEEKSTCIYFIEKRYEDGELLSPKCHILFQESILKTRKVNCGHK